LKTWIIIWLIAFLMLSCQKKEKPPVLAKVDGKEISLEEFKLAYQFNPFLTRVQNPDSAKWFLLKSLIAEKLIALNGPTNDQQIQDLLEAYRHEATIEVFWKKVIEPKVTITDSELQQAYLRSKIKKVVQYLIFTDHNEARQAYQLIRQGMSFEQLAQLRGFDEHFILSDTLSFTGQLPHIEEQVFKMKVGEVSPPVKEGLYFFVLKVIGEQRDIFTSEEDFNYRENSLRKKLKRQRMQKAMEQFLAQNLPQTPYQLSKEKVKQLLKVIEKRIFENHKFGKNEGLTSDLSFLPDELANDLLNLPLVDFYYGERWTVKYLLKRLSVSSYPLRFDNRGLFRKSFLLALKNILDDQIILHEAQQRNLHNSDYVKQQVAIWRDYLLFKKGLANILKDKSLYNSQPIYEYLNKKTIHYVIKINKTMLDTVRLFKTDMAVLKQHFPGRLAVPVIPLLTGYDLQYQFEESY